MIDIQIQFIHLLLDLLFFIFFLFHCILLLKLLLLPQQKNHFSSESIPCLRKIVLPITDINFKMFSLFDQIIQLFHLILQYFQFTLNVFLIVHLQLFTLLFEEIIKDMVEWVSESAHVLYLNVSRHSRKDELKQLEVSLSQLSSILNLDGFICTVQHISDFLDFFPYIFLLINERETPFEFEFVITHIFQ